MHCSNIARPVKGPSLRGHVTRSLWTDGEGERFGRVLGRQSCTECVLLGGHRCERPFSFGVHGPAVEAAPAGPVRNVLSLDAPARGTTMDGDGKLDILGKPYSFETPRLHVWLQE